MRAICTLLLLLGTTRPALAQEAKPSPPAPAQSSEEAKKTSRAHNLEANRLFNLGQFSQAVEAYQKAYKAWPMPAFLYNLGQCHARMDGVDNLERAKFFFEGYLTNKPDAPNRQEVEEQIAEIKRKQEILRSFQRPVLLMPGAVPADQAAPEPTPWYKSWWLWTIVGVAVAGGATAAVLLTRPEDPVPVEGSLWPRTIELELAW